MPYVKKRVPFLQRGKKRKRLSARPNEHDAAFVHVLGWYALHQLIHKVTRRQDAQATAYFRLCARKGTIPQYSMLKKILGMKN